MNWKRIAVFVLILFLATAAAGIPFDVIAEVLSARQAHEKGWLREPLPLWVLLGKALAVFTAATVVFYQLANRQHDRPWRHALMVAVIAWLVSLPINVWGLGVPETVWSPGIIALLVALSVGVGLRPPCDRTSSDSQEPAA